MDGMNAIAPLRRLALPADAPLAMPEQDFSEGRLRPHPAGPGVAARRVAVLGGALALGAAVSMLYAAGLARDGLGALDALAVPVFGTLLLLIALSFCNACAGLRAAPLLGPPAPLRARTALLVPIHNEETARVLAMAEAMREALDAGGEGSAFDIFILSDSTDPVAREQEAAGMARLMALHPGSVFYRLRRENSGRKAGNVAEWVRRFGGAYAHFVILDADSVMEAPTLHALAAAMEADPRAGLIQSLPSLIGARTRFARLQQWAARLHGPLIARGLAAWHGEAGNYWGHNAIIRTRAFAEAAGLPEVPGRRPFGGPIMSHDFVEAALLRRAGWGVHMLPMLGGSHESGPPTIGAAAARDRRWCQGNLQHAALLGAAGLHPLSRLHLLGGILSYLASPLWLVLLLIGAAQGWLGQAGPGAWCFALVVALLLLPKLMAGWRQLAGTLREIALTALLAPIGMVTQTLQIADILLGRDSGWGAQGREATVPSWRVALRAHTPHLVAGVLLLAAAPTWWMLPVALPLLASPAIARFMAQPCAASSFATPEEKAPSPLLCRVAMLRRAWQLELDAGTMALPPLPDLPAFLSVAPRRETAAALS
jgi:membrane glycosyltransferase